MKQQSIIYFKTGLRDFRGLIFSFEQICFPTQNDKSNIHHALKFTAEKMETLTEADVLCTWPSYVSHFELSPLISLHISAVTHAHGQAS